MSAIVFVPSPKALHSPTVPKSSPYDVEDASFKLSTLKNDIMNEFNESQH
jgi:hypothetical protein